MSRALPRINLPFMKDYSQPQLFEIAWEVANKGYNPWELKIYMFSKTILVGGIYTVIKTKVPVTVEEYGDNYTLIGPLSKKNSSLEVESCVPECPITKYCLESMRNEGVRVVFGKWLIDGSPSVILFDLESVLHRLNEWKADIWALSSIPSPSHDQEMNDAVLFGYLVAWFIGLVSQLKFVTLLTKFSL